MDDLVSDYRVRRVKSLSSVLSHLKPVREHFGDWRAVTINFGAIENYITKRLADEKSNATINRELELLRRALRLAHDRQLLPSIPKVRVLPESNTPPATRSTPISPTSRTTTTASRSTSCPTTRPRRGSLETSDAGADVNYYERANRQYRRRL